MNTCINYIKKTKCSVFLTPPWKVADDGVLVVEIDLEMINDCGPSTAHKDQAIC